MLDEALRRVSVAGKEVRAQRPRVLDPGMPASPARPGPEPGSAPRLRLAVRCGAHPEHGRGVHPPAPRKARAGCRGAASRPSAGWGTGCVATEVPRENGDADRCSRRTRLRLLAWSGGLTLVILVALGTALYLRGRRILDRARYAISWRPRADPICGFSQSQGQVPRRLRARPGSGASRPGPSR